MNEVVTQQAAEQNTDNTADTEKQQQWVIAALYQFLRVSFPADLRNRLQELSTHLQLRGTLIVADEGINGTVAGNRAGIDELHQVLLNEGFTNMEYKESFSKDKPFKRMKVKLKHEIVTLGVDVEPLAQVVHYLNPEEWHQFIQQEDVVVVDTRNRYEYAAGTFKNAI
ncbi:MAG TPA: rhodanese-like domain-containing protein, partial [Aquirhabdus sp.]